MNSSSIMAQFPGFVNARIPQDVFVFFDDFLTGSMSATDDAAKWEYTAVGGDGGTYVIGNGTDNTRDNAGGFALITPVASADDGVNLQCPGKSFHLEDGNALYFEARVNCQDVSNNEFFIGMSISDEEIITTGLADGFGFILAAGVLSAVSAKDTNAKTVGTDITETDDDWIRLAFFWDGSNELIAYVDTNDDGNFDKEIYRFKADVTADYFCDNMMLTPTIEVITGATAEADVLWVDYVYCAQTRYHE